MKKIIIVLLCILLIGCTDKKESKKDDPEINIIDLNTVETFIISFNESKNSTVEWLWGSIDDDNCSRHTIDFKIVLYEWNSQISLWEGPFVVEVHNGVCEMEGETNLTYFDTIRVYEFQWEGIVTITYELKLIKD